MFLKESISQHTLSRTKRKQKASLRWRKGPDTECTDYQTMLFGILTPKKSPEMCDFDRSCGYTYRTRLFYGSAIVSGPCAIRGALDSKLVAGRASKSASMLEGSSTSTHIEDCTH